MTILILGLILFFLPHSFTMVRGARATAIMRLGLNGYKAAYSLVSALGLILIIWGFGRYRATGPVQVWDPPVWTQHLALLLMLPALILLVATYAPGEIKRRVKHPMLAAIKIWALAHLLANGDLGGMVLFGAFLAWAVVDRIAVKRRIEASGPELPNRGWRNDVIAVIGGVALYIVVVTVFHPYVIGVPVLPG